ADAPHAGNGEQANRGRLKHFLRIGQLGLSTYQWCRQHWHGRKSGAYSSWLCPREAFVACVRLGFTCRRKKALALLLREIQRLSEQPQCILARHIRRATLNVANGIGTYPCTVG